MRDSDLANLQQPLGDVDPSDVENALSDALQIRVKALDDLSREIKGDIDAENFGISWWAGHLDDKRRILITDHVLASLPSIQGNLNEAALHRLEAVQAWDRVSDRLARMVQLDGTTRYPPAQSPVDLLPDKMATLHVAGYFRALGSALDCLAATTIGVLAIPKKILMADFRAVLSWLSESSHAKKHARHPPHRDFSSHVSDTIARAAPEGWLKWSDDYRNMYVHRPRRKEIGMLNVASHLVDAQQRPILRTTPISILLKVPDVSDVESFVQLRKAPLTLEEPALLTMEEALRAVVYLAEETIQRLTQVWRTRREDPDLLRQPADQWSTISDTQHQAFQGFHPGSLKVQPDFLVASPDTVARIKGAALSTEDDELWKRQGS